MSLSWQKSPKAERGRTLGPENEDLDPDDMVWRATLGEEDWEVLLQETPDDTSGDLQEDKKSEGKQE